jgi:hypothetical protein
VTSEELAIKVINLRHCLEVANKCLKDDGLFGVICSEDAGPTFSEGKKFWAEVRLLSSSVDKLDKIELRHFQRHQDKQFEDSNG